MHHRPFYLQNEAERQQSDSTKSLETLLCELRELGLSGTALCRRVVELKAVDLDELSELLHNNEPKMPGHTDPFVLLKPNTHDGIAA